MVITLSICINGDSKFKTFKVDKSVGHHVKQQLYDKQCEFLIIKENREEYICKKSLITIIEILEES